MTTLTCSDARELVSDYIDGKLPETTAADLETHLQTCPSCPPLYASLIQTLADLKALGDASLSEHYAAALARADEQAGDAEPGTHRPGDTPWLGSRTCCPRPQADRDCQHPNGLRGAQHGVGHSTGPTREAARRSSLKR